MILSAAPETSFVDENPEQEKLDYENNLKEIGNLFGDIVSLLKNVPKEQNSLLFGEDGTKRGRVSFGGNRCEIRFGGHEMMELFFTSYMEQIYLDDKETHLENCLIPKEYNKGFVFQKIDGDMCFRAEGEGLKVTKNLGFKEVFKRIRNHFFGRFLHVITMDQARAPEIEECFFENAVISYSEVNAKLELIKKGLGLAKEAIEKKGQSKNELKLLDNLNKAYDKIEELKELILEIKNDRDFTLQGKNGEKDYVIIWTSEYDWTIEYGSDILRSEIFKSPNSSILSIKLNSKIFLSNTQSPKAKLDIIRLSNDVIIDPETLKKIHLVTKMMEMVAEEIQKEFNLLPPHSPQISQPSF